MKRPRQHEAADKARESDDVTVPDNMPAKARESDDCTVPDDMPWSARPPAKCFDQDGKYTGTANYTITDASTGAKLSVPGSCMSLSVGVRSVYNLESLYGLHAGRCACRHACKQADMQACKQAGRHANMQAGVWCVHAWGPDSNIGISQEARVLRVEVCRRCCIRAG